MGNGYTTILPLEVLTQRKLCSRLYSIEIEFYSNKQKMVFEPSFEGLRGNVRTPSIARKAHGRLPVFHN